MGPIRTTMGRTTMGPIRTTMGRTTMGPIRTTMGPIRTTMGLIRTTMGLILTMGLIITKIIITQMESNYLLPNHFVISCVPFFRFVSFLIIASVILFGLGTTNSKICITGFSI